MRGLHYAWIVSFTSIGIFTAAPAWAAAPNIQGVAEIDHPEQYAQVLALSDVHGMYDALIRLLTQAAVIDAAHGWKAGKTLLVVVGDSIDKGPQSIEVLDLWIALSKQAESAGGRVIHLLGNHEAEFLAYGKKDGKSEALLTELKRKDLRVRDLRDSDTPRGRFIHSMPVAAKVGRWLFCHAGLFPNLSWKDFSTRTTALLTQESYEDPLLLGDDSILEAKDWWSKKKHRRALEDRLSAMGIYGAVQGHQPKAYGIQDHIGVIDGGKLIKLDVGMSVPAGSHPGELLRFGQPAQMLEMKTPSLQMIDSTGKTSALEPQ